MKRFNGKPNVVGRLIERTRKKKGITKAELCRKLELLGVEFDRNEIYRIENYRMIVKDFELIALMQVLNISFNDLEKELQEIENEEYEKDF